MLELLLNTSSKRCCESHRNADRLSYFLGNIDFVEVCEPRLASTGIIIIFYEQNFQGSDPLSDFHGRCLLAEVMNNKNVCFFEETVT